MVLNRKIIDKFFDKVEKKVVKAQTDIAKDALSLLFRRSPHAGENQAQGEYDANHKIAINNGPSSSHHGPTNSSVASKAYVNREKAKLSRVKIGDVVTVLNDTEHAIDVEIGRNNPGNRWHRRGYYPYRTTKIDLMGKYKNVIR